MVRRDFSDFLWFESPPLYARYQWRTLKIRMDKRFPMSRATKFLCALATRQTYVTRPAKPKGVQIQNMSCIIYGERSGRDGPQNVFTWAILSRHTVPHANMHGFKVSRLAFGRHWPCLQGTFVNEIHAELIVETLATFVVRCNGGHLGNTFC